MNLKTKTFKSFKIQAGNEIKISLKNKSDIQNLSRYDKRQSITMKILDDLIMIMNITYLKPNSMMN